MTFRNEIKKKKKTTSFRKNKKKKKIVRTFHMENYLKKS